MSALHTLSLSLSPAATLNSHAAVISLVQEEHLGASEVPGVYQQGIHVLSAVILKFHLVLETLIVDVYISATDQVKA